MPVKLDLTLIANKKSIINYQTGRLQEASSHIFIYVDKKHRYYEDDFSITSNAYPVIMQIQ